MGEIVRLNHLLLHRVYGILTPLTLAGRVKEGDASIIVWRAEFDSAGVSGGGARRGGEWAAG